MKHGTPCLSRVNILKYLVIESEITEDYFMLTKWAKYKFMTTRLSRKNSEWNGNIANPQQ